MSWEALAGFSSAVIALCALFLTVWQTHTTQKHNMLSVTPHLTTWTNMDLAKNTYAIELLNNGIGPALIKSFTIEVDGQAITGDGTTPIEKALAALFPQYEYQSWQSFISKGYMMSAKETRNLLTVQFLGGRAPTPEEIDNAAKRFRVVINYESIYQKAFTFDTAKFASPKS